jgi:3-oxoacyl-[acyl-carrier protein] reductase
MPTEQEFQGRLALVTGASNGIGAETAVELAKAGANVIITYHSAKDAAEAVVKRIRAEGRAGEALAADLTTFAGTQKLIAAVAGKPVDILVNNAGSLIERKKILEMSYELWDQTLMLNLTSAFLLCQAVLPGMVERKWGAIVNVGSVAGRNGGGLGAAAYSTAKGAISVLTRSIAKEFAPAGVRCNCVAPGTIDTNYHRRFSTEQMLSGVKAATPLGRLGTSEEIADVILFLCSEKSRFVIGQTVEVNGGFWFV